MRRIGWLAVWLALVSAARADPIAFEKEITPGGLVYWYHARPDLPKTTLVAGWRDGTGFATAGKAGLSPVGVRMILRAASQHALDNLFEAMRDIGATADMRTDGWNVQATLTGSPRNLAAAADLASRVLSSPLPDQKSLDRIESQLADSVVAESRVAETAAEWAAFRLGAPAYPWNGLREKADLYRGVTLADVETWRRRVIARDNLTLAVEGPTGPEELGPILDKLAGALSPTSDTPTRPPFAFSAHPRTLVIETPQPQAVIYEIAPTDLGDDPRRLAAYVAVAVLGEGFESRLMRRVRQTLGDAYDVKAFLADFADHAPLVITGAVAPEKGPEAVAAIAEEYARWREQGVGADELGAVASRTRANNDAYFRTQGAAPLYFVKWSLDGNPPNALFDYADRLARYTPESVNAEIKARFPAGPLLTVIVAPSAAPYHADCVVKSWREAANCP